MPFLYLLEYAAVVFGITFFITQFLIPWVRGRPSLPMFRRGARLEAGFRKAKADVDNAVMEDEVFKSEMEAAELRGLKQRD